MFFRIYFCKLNISKNVRPVLAALSINGLIGTSQQYISSNISGCPPSRERVMTVRVLLPVIYEVQLTSSILGFNGVSKSAGRMGLQKPTVPACNSCTKCVGSPSARPIATKPPGAGCDTQVLDLTTELSFYSQPI